MRKTKDCMKFVSKMEDEFKKLQGTLMSSTKQSISKVEWQNKK